MTKENDRMPLRYVDIRLKSASTQTARTIFDRAEELGGRAQWVLGVVDIRIELKCGDDASPESLFAYLPGVLDVYVHTAASVPAVVI